MSIPDYQSFFRPLLAYCEDGAEHTVGGAMEALSIKFALSDEDRRAVIPSGGQTIVRNRVQWAGTYLQKAGALERTRRGHFRVTERGRSLLRQYPERIDIRALRQFPEFVAFVTPRPKEESGTGEAGTPAESIQAPVPNETPDEIIERARASIDAKLESDLLERIAENSPAFFERLVVDLIVAMGYGGSRERVVRMVGRSGDEGIDGIVNEDALGLDVVYIQAKRYAADQTIGREKIQQFAGALVGQGATKGVFVATCGYSRGARDYAQKVPQRIILIDGPELARLLLRYNVGVRTEREFAIKRIDLDYFEEE
jgi:restriction system protein